jgi:hypothetical protein
MAEAQSVKKRSRRWVVVAVVALAVALLVGALVYREPPPYEFLRREQRAWTHIAPYPAARGDAAIIRYVSDLSVGEVEERAKRELMTKGWSVQNGRFVSPSGIAETFRVGSADGYQAEAGRWVRGKTVINIDRPATLQDRFHASIDWLLGR